MGRVSIHCCSLFLLLISTARYAQQAGTFSGTVLDQAGKAVPGANIEVRNELYHRQLAEREELSEICGGSSPT